MKKGSNKRDALDVAVSAAAVCCLAGVCLVSLYKTLTKSMSGQENWISVLLFASVLLIMIWPQLQVETRTCRITKSGIGVKYLFRKEKQFSWHEFQQICICFEPVKKRNIPPRFTDRAIICFVLKGAKKDYWGFWNIYSKRFFRKILFIGYSEEALQELRECCPNDVVDLRNDKVYQNR